MRVALKSNIFFSKGSGRTVCLRKKRSDTLAPGFRSATARTFAPSDGDNGLVYKNARAQHYTSTYGTFRKAAVPLKRKLNEQNLE